RRVLRGRHTLRHRWKLDIENEKRHRDGEDAIAEGLHARRYGWLDGAQETQFGRVGPMRWSFAWVRSHGVPPRGIAREGRCFSAERVSIAAPDGARRRRGAVERFELDDRRGVIIADPE